MQELSEKRYFVCVIFAIDQFTHRKIIIKEDLTRLRPHIAYEEELLLNNQYYLW